MAAYPAAVARALHALAESNPTPQRYAEERARILKEAQRGDRQLPAHPRR